MSDMTLQYGEVRRTSGWDLFTSLRHPCKFQRLSRLSGVTTRQSSSERQPNFAALNRGRHLCLAGRPSRWALAHISSIIRPLNVVLNFWRVLRMFSDRSVGSSLVMSETSGVYRQKFRPSHISASTFQLMVQFRLSHCWPNYWSECQTSFCCKNLRWTTRCLFLLLWQFSSRCATSRNESTVGNIESATSKDRCGELHEQWSKHRLARTTQEKSAKICKAERTISLAKM